MNERFQRPGHQEQNSGSGSVGRRAFLAGLSAGAGSVAVGVYMRVAVLDDDSGVPQAPAGAPVLPAVATAHPGLRVTSLAELAVGDVVDFQFPTTESPASLFRLGRSAAGGVGPDRDVVAFATDCTHMGCPLRGQFQREHAVLGPCPCHFTTFDLTHRGMVVLGQATENLPQIILRLDGDDIIATGTLGLLYGFRHNLEDAPIVEGL